jgi:hypothetical protein
MKNKALFGLVFILLAQFACTMPLPAVVPATPTAILSTPTLLSPPSDEDSLPVDVTPMPSETPVSPAHLFQQVALTEEFYSESGESPVYTLETNTPILEGSDDPRAVEFNRQAAAIVEELVADFKSGFEYLSDEPISAGSFFQVTFVQLAPPGDILSIRFDVDGYSDGAAHPYHLTRTLNFDLETGQALSLDMLFRPDSDFLTLIADYCSAELATRDIGFELGFSGGADPLPENYRNWNLTYEGLLITFDEYQVAPYAAGMQQVLVPFELLQGDLLDEFAERFVLWGQ